MTENELKSVIKECDLIFSESDSYEDAVKKVCKTYDVSYDEIYVPEDVRNSDKKLELDIDSLCDKLGFANNSVGITELFSGLDKSINSINTELLSSNIASSTGKISQNPKLHGFLFEEMHAAIFNMRARLAGKPYIARVLKPLPGENYAKNSVDIIIRNTKTGQDLQRYQLKCCENSETTIQCINNGNYNNQRLLVADGQADAVRKAFPRKTVTTHLEYDGITSNPIAHKRAKEIQNALQSGNWDVINWSEYTTKDLLYAGIQSLKTPVLIDVIMHTAAGVGSKVTNKTNKSWEEVAKGIGGNVFSDTSKLAISTATQMYIKKELPSTVLAKIGAPEIYAGVSLAIDTAKEVTNVANGTHTKEQALDNVAKKTVVVAAQLAGAAGGGALGTYLGGPVGTKIGMVIGSTGAGIVADKAYDIAKDIFFKDESIMKTEKKMNKNVEVNSTKRKVALLN